MRACHIHHTVLSCAVGTLHSPTVGTAYRWQNGNNSRHDMALGRSERWSSVLRLCIMAVREQSSPHCSRSYGPLRSVPLIRLSLVDGSVERTGVCSCLYIFVFRVRLRVFVCCNGPCFTFSFFHSLAPPVSLSVSLSLPQVPCARTCVGRWAVWLLGEERQVNA